MAVTYRKSDEDLLSNISDQLNELMSEDRSTSRASSGLIDSNTRVFVDQSHSFSKGSVVSSDGTGWVAVTDGTIPIGMWGVVDKLRGTTRFSVIIGGTARVNQTNLVQGKQYTLVGGTFTLATEESGENFVAASNNRIVVQTAGGGGVDPPPEDGTVFASKSDLSGGEWTMLLDIGRNATGKAGKIQVLSPNASGVGVEIDGALVTASSKKLTIREIDVCDSGTAKKMLILASAPY